MSNFNEAMCRVCLQDYREDFESVFADPTEKDELSHLGLMYEELFHVAIRNEPDQPHFLCNYCSLQLKLFHKFKAKALESHTKFTHAVEEKLFIFDIVSETEHNAEFDKNDTDEGSIDVLPVNDQDGTEDEDTNSVKEEDAEFEDVQYLEDGEVATVISEEEEEAAEEEGEYEEKEDQEQNDDSIEKNRRKRSRPPTGVYPCKTCGRLFGKKIDLIQHRSKRHKRIHFPCSQCPKKFLSEEQLQVHTKVHLGLPAYQCEICNKPFNQKVHYVTHLNNHRNKRDVKCNLCGKGFLTKSDLKIHLRMHTDERRYECDICGAKFRAHTHMKNHRYTHLGKTLECEYCQQMYTTPATLKTHIQSVHQNLCPYLCTVCPKQFKRKHHLLAHLKMHSSKLGETTDYLES